MLFLTTKEKKLYSDLLKIFNDSGLHRVSTFEAFLELKYQSSGCLTSYYNVWKYEQNYF